MSDVTRVAGELLRGQRAPVGRLIAQTVTYSVAEGVTVGLLVPWLRALLAGELTRSWAWLAALAGCVAVGWLSRYGVEMQAPRLSSAVRRTLYDIVGAHLVRLPLGWFTPTRASELERLLGPGVDVTVRAVTLVQSLLGAVLTPAVVAVFLLAYDWPTGLAALAVTPVIPVAFALARRLTDRADAETDRAVTEASSRLLEFARAQPVLRANGHDDAGRALLATALHDQHQASRRALWRAMPGEHLGELAVQLAFTSVVAVGLARVTGAGLDPALGVALLILGVQLLRPVASIVAAASSVRVCGAALRRIDAVLRAAPLPEPLRSRPPGMPSVELDRVSFGYGGAAVLDDVSLRVPAGSTTALVGASGAGKSTIIRLIARFYDVVEGRVRVGGVDVRELSARDLARTVSLVPQDVYLFEGSILDNVRFGAPRASDEDVLRAARRARVDVIASRLPGGWDAKVGEGGGLLSGGERQRVAIARALVANAPVVLLDEPTSALDAQNQAAINEALAELSQAVTLLIVAHNLTTIVDADQIAVLDGGRIVERGRHDELLALGGRYTRMWQEQQRARGWRLTDADPSARPSTRSPGMRPGDLGGPRKITGGRRAAD